MRLLLKLLLVVAGIFVLGFVLFVANFPRANDFDLTTSTQKLDDIRKSEIGIVILTGGGGARIERGLGLFDQNIADRVLISGTHPDVRKIDLAYTTDMAILECCVDLGSQAETTIGNAAETRDWVSENGYRAIFLVTTEWHLPRARAEIGMVLPDLKIISVPVESKSVPTKDWIKSSEAWEILTKEYVKTLIAQARSLV